MKVSRTEVSSTTTGNFSNMDFPQKGIGKLLGSGHVNANITAWSYDMEGHAKKCVERHCELASTNIEQFCDVSTHCVNDHQFKKEELETVGDLSKVSSRIVLRCLGAHRQMFGGL